MCACHTDVGTPPSPALLNEGQDLHDLLSDHADSGFHGDSSSDMEEHGLSMDQTVPEDLYTQLAERERDLQLAAELGKALLDQNDELKKKHEQTVEEYNSKLEEMAQEKHELRLRCTALETEYEMTIKELHNDINSLRQDLDEHKTQAHVGNKSQAQVMEELMHQNERLTQQLKQAAETEEQLQAQVDTLRHQVTSRKTSIHEHVHQLQMLRDEITMLSDRKCELERRILLISEERDNLAGSLDEAQDRILMLDRHKTEYEYTIDQQRRELRELQDQNTSLHDRFESSSTSLNDTQSSLLAELETSGIGESDSNQETNPMAEQTCIYSDTNPNGNYPGYHSNITYLSYDGTNAFMSNVDDDIECDDDIVMNQDMQLMSQECSQAHKMEYINLTDELKQEIMEVYSQLQRLVLDLRGERWYHQDVPRENGLRAGSLLAVLRELRELTEGIVKRQKLEESECSEVDYSVLETQVSSLKKELCSSEGQLERIKSELQFRDKQLEKHTNELAEMTKKLTQQQEDIAALQAERDKLLDGSAGITRDQILEEAREDRDKAIQKFNTVEQDLAKARMDLLSLDSQLMNTIQLKLELSQQLEQWQLDMQDLVSSQVTSKLQEEKANRLNKAMSASASPTKTKLKHKFFSWR